MLRTNGHRFELGETLEFRIMRIPSGLAHVLARFVIDHYASGGLHGDSVQVSHYCGVLAQSWAQENLAVVEAYELDSSALSSWAARFGKTLGDFLLTEGRP